ncbi:MAG: hypothetical protein AAF862_13165 [Pseudomonadota bacterium]
MCGLAIIGAQNVGSAAAQSAHASAAKAQNIAALAKSWPTEPNFSFSFSPLAPSRPSRAADAALFDGEDDYSGLPREGAFELVDAYCSGCHSLQIVMQQRASKRRWASLLLWMTEKQNMPPLEEDEAAVLSYLAKHFGAN